MLTVQFGFVLFNLQRDLSYFLCARVKEEFLGKKMCEHNFHLPFLSLFSTFSN